MTTCDICKQECIPTPYTLGYAKNAQGQIVCFTCCGVQDAEYMQTHNKIMLYLGKEDNGKWSVSNWPGTLNIPVRTPRKGHHNIAHTRYDVWFTFAGKHWHGVQYGDWTQICHCKAVK